MNSWLAPPLHSQKMGFVRWMGVPLNAARTFSPSGAYSLGSSTPAAARKVGSRSTAVTTDVVSIFPLGVWAGQRTMNGTRMPPAKRERFSPLRPPVSPTE